MLTIIIGVVISLGLVWMVIYSNLNSYTGNSYAKTLEPIAIVAILTISIVIGLVYPIGGYKEPELVEEVELATLSNTTVSTDRGSQLYVCVSANNVYSYKYEVPNTSTVEGKMYKFSTVSENVEEVETNTDKAVLQIYEANAKKSIWGFALRQKKTSYIFIVPEGSVSYSAE